MHAPKKLTKHGRYPTQHNQLPTKCHVQLEGNSILNYKLWSATKKLANLALMHTPQHLVIHSVSLKSHLMWMVQWELPVAPAPMHLSILQLLLQFPPVKDSQYEIHYSNNLVIDDVNTTKASRRLRLRIRVWNTSPSFLLTYKHLEPSWYKVRLHTSVGFRTNLQPRL